MLSSAAIIAVVTPLAAGQLGDITAGAQVDEPALVRLGAHHPHQRGLRLDGWGLFVGKAPVAPAGPAGTAWSPTLDLLLLQANALLTDGTWGLNASLRLRLDEVIPPSWDQTVLLFQEAYASWRLDERLEVKLGKVYQQFGRPWDYSFNGPLIFATDLKMRPHLGGSAEGTAELSRQVSLDYAAQYFLFDGESFSALGHNVGLRDVRQRNTVLLRAAPTLQLAKSVSVQLGGSAKVGHSVSYEAPAQAGGANAAPTRRGVDNVVRTLAMDFHAEAYNLGFFVEAGRQFDSSSSIQATDVALRQDGVTPAFSFVWVAAKYKLGAWSPRLSYNDSFYADGSRESLWNPGVTITLNPHFELLGEFNLWRTRQPASRPDPERNVKFRDRSFYLALMGSF